MSITEDERATKSPDGVVVEAPRPRGRPKAMSDDQRRAEIIAAARALFVEGGYGAMTTDAVAARCRISKRAIYEHFADKADLFGAIVAAHNIEMIALPLEDDGLSLADALARIFRVDIDRESDQSRKSFLRAAMDQSQYPELPMLVVTRGIEPSRRALAGWIEARAALGELNAPDPEKAARVLMDMMFGAQIFRPGSREDWPNEQARAAHQRYTIGVFLEGFRPR
ncbi:TetR/AcrR family transcriptional regulator [Methylopila sp. M107]|uniref:TetR/AcrR family transcriptional regulator n=1 Tax=Methylopila sp. M107 TaxID=1101190 RepID=UPI00035C9A52|nr:TetR/AcrR family transcriptional regulator [Methylopila sp. M107]